MVNPTQKNSFITSKAEALEAIGDYLECVPNSFDDYELDLRSLAIEALEYLEDNDEEAGPIRTS